MKPAAHLLVGHAVRVTPPDRRPLATSDGVTVRLTLASTPAPEPPFDGILVDVNSAGCFMVLRADDGSVGFWSAEYVRFTDPELATRMLRADAATKDVTTDGRTLSQVCTELVEAKQAAARLNDALRDLAIELDLPMGLPENAIVEAIRVKMGVVRHTPPRWVPANDVEDGWPFLAAVDPDGEYIALEPSGKRLLPGDTAVFRSRNALVLIGEWPPLPQGKP